MQPGEAEMFAVGQRVETEYGAGRVAESSARRVYIELDDGQSLNVGTGTYGYERIHALAECPACDGAVCDECSEHYDAQAIDGTYECVGFSECRCLKCIAAKRAAIAAVSS